MRLIGMLDSPYVRRVAISLRIAGIAFEHEPLSVFGSFEEFAAINPAVKAPTLIADDGTVLMDSTLILQYLDHLSTPERSLKPGRPREFLQSQRLIGLALAACEKSVQIVYETNLRPEDRRHQPWLDRVRRQLVGAYDDLEAGFEGVEGWCFGTHPLQADITAAVAFRFAQFVLPDVVPAERYPNLAALSRRAEALPEFLSTPIE